MSIKEKIAIIDEAKEGYGLNLACEAMELPKATWYYHKNQKVDYEEKYNYLRPIIEEIIRGFPEYGYPRIKSELQEEYGLVVNHKVILRLLNLWDLKIMRAARNNEKSAVKKAIETAGAEINLVKKLEDTGLFEISYTDFTRIIYDNGDKSAWLIPIIGHKSKMVYGWSIGPHADTE
ncbi:MAG: IS3 family transposase, partial [Gillisia sp.]